MGEKWKDQRNFSMKKKRKKRNLSASGEIKFWYLPKIIKTDIEGCWDWHKWKAFKKSWEIKCFQYIYHEILSFKIATAYTLC